MSKGKLKLDPSEPIPGRHGQWLCDDLIRLLNGDDPQLHWEYVRKFLPVLDTQWWLSGGSTNHPRLAMAWGWMTGNVDREFVERFMEEEARIGLKYTEPGGYENYHLLAMIALRDAPGAERWWSWWIAINRLHYVRENGRIIRPRTRASVGPRDQTGEVVFATLAGKPLHVLRERGVGPNWLYRRHAYAAQAAMVFHREIPWNRVPVEDVPLRWPMTFQRLYDGGWVSYFETLGGYDNHCPAAAWERSTGTEFFAFENGRPGAASHARLRGGSGGDDLRVVGNVGKRADFRHEFLTVPSGEPIVIGKARRDAQEPEEGAERPIGGEEIPVSEDDPASPWIEGALRHWRAFERTDEIEHLGHAGRKLLKAVEAREGGVA